MVSANKMPAGIKEFLTYRPCTSQTRPDQSQPSGRLAASPAGRAGRAGRPGGPSVWPCLAVLGRASPVLPSGRLAVWLAVWPCKALEAKLWANDGQPRQGLAVLALEVLTVWR